MKRIEESFIKIGEEIIETRNTEKVFTRNELMIELGNIQREMLYIIQQNKELKQDYNTMKERERKIEEILGDFENGEFSATLSGGLNSPNQFF